MDKRDFISIHTIVCPQCKVKQTGIVRESPGIVFIIPNSGPYHDASGSYEIPFGTPYLRCSYLSCQHIMTDDELAEVTMQRVQFPNQINK